MTSWPVVELGAICEFKYGKSLPADQRQPGPFPVYGSNGVVGCHSESLTSGATIVVGRKGSFGEVHLSPAPCWPIDTTYYIDESSTSVDLKWLAHVLPSLRLTELNRSAAIPGLNREDAYRRTVVLPPLGEQRRVAAILDQADALRAKRRQGISYLDELPRSIFDASFGDPVTGSGGRRARIRDVATVQTGPFGSLLHREDYIDGGVPIINPMHIRDSRVVADPTFSVRPDKNAALAAYQLREGDVVLGRRGEMGRCAVVTPEQAGWLCGTGSLIVRPTQALTSRFLQAVLSHPSTKRTLSAARWEVRCRT